MGTHYGGNAKERRALDVLIKLFRAAESVQAVTNVAPAAAGLTTSQFGALEALYHLGPLRQNILARKLLRTGGNMTLVIDNLEIGGLVERSADPTDRRASMVKITAKGRRLMEKVLPAHVSDVVQTISVLTEHEQEVLGKLCKKLGRSIQLEKK